MVFGNKILQGNKLNIPTVFAMGTTTLGSLYSSVVVDMPDGVTAGKLLICYLQLRDGTSAASTGWTLLNNSTDTTRVYIFYKIATGSEGSTQTFTNNGFSASAKIVAYSVADTVTISGNTIASATGFSDITYTNANLPTLTKALYIAYYFDNTTTLPPVSSGNYSEEFQTAFNNGEFQVYHYGVGDNTTSAGGITWDYDSESKTYGGFIINV